LPRILTRESVERQSKSGGALFYITVEAEFDFVASEDGSKHTVRTFGEAMDSGDKATNKAMSAAYKYAAFQAFCIPTEAQDADAQTHEVQPKAPTGFDEWLMDFEAVAENGMAAFGAAWKNAKPEYRAYMTKTMPAKGKALKAKAESVTEPA
jgi:hypothetical protein